MNEDKWFKPKKCMRTNYFFTTHENKVELKKNNKKHVALVDNDHVEEDEEDE